MPPAIKHLIGSVRELCASIHGQLKRLVCAANCGKALPFAVHNGSCSARDRLTPQPGLLRTTGFVPLLLKLIAQPTRPPVPMIHPRPITAQPLGIRGVAGYRTYSYPVIRFDPAFYLPVVSRKELVQKS